MYQQRSIRHVSYNTGGNQPMFLRQLSSVGSSFLPLPQSQPVLIRAAGYRSTASSSSSSYHHRHLPVPPRPPAVAPPHPPPWWSAQGSRPPLPASRRAPHRSHPVRTCSLYPPQLRARDQNVAPPGVFTATRTRGVPPPPWWSAANPLAGSVPRSGLHTSGGLMDGGDRGREPPYKRRKSTEDEKRRGAANEEREGGHHHRPRGDSAGRTRITAQEGGPKKGHQHHRPDPSVTGEHPRAAHGRRDEEGGRDQQDQDWETVGRRKNSARRECRDKEECRDKDKDRDRNRDRTRDGDKNSRHHSGQKDGGTSFPPKDAKLDGAPRPGKSAWSQLWDSQQPPAPRTHSSEQKPRGGAPEPGPSTPKPNNPWFKDGAEGVAAREANVQGGHGRGGGPWRQPPPQAPGPTHTHPNPWFRVPLALQRNWEVLPASRRPPGDTPFEFSVLSYNILSQDLLRDNVYLYRHCHPMVLPWEYRLPNLLAEIRHYDADILCLQEVQEDHYEEQIKPALQEIGYQCEYKKRTGGKPDGCAVVFKASRLSLLAAHPVEYLRPGISVLDRDNVGLVVLLQPNHVSGGGQIRDPSDFICVANTHLLYNPRRGDVKLAQLAVLLAEVSRLSGLPDGSTNPVVMCGDFNSTPWSPLYNLLTMGFLEYQGLPIGRVSGQEINPRQQRLLTVPLWPLSLGINTHCQYNRYATQQRQSDTTQQNLPDTTQPNLPDTTQPNLPDTTATAPGVEGAISNLTILDLIANALNINRPPRIDHSVKLRSSYRHILGLVRDKEFEVTTCHTQTAMTVDYIMYTPGPGPDSPLPGGRGLELLGRLSLVGQAELEAVNRLPNQHHSSDHLPLLARFRLH